jgi:hypothetical protein
MGVSVANLPLSVSDDNINLGDKDSVRRRALWALEGKPDVNTFSKVEIPDISTPELPTKPFEFCTSHRIITDPAPLLIVASATKPSFPIMGSTFGNAAGKRDSFGKHLTATTSSKEQLHTLVEEDEEGEEECEDDSTMVSSPVELSSPTEVAPKLVEALDSTPTPQRHRPVHLNLRQLSLGKENFSLPTPLTPTPRSSKGLRSLTLATTPVPITSMGGDESSTITNRAKRHSVMLPSVSPVVTPARRASLDLEGSFRSPSSFRTDSAQKRRSISYKHSVDIASNQLPTPAITPTVEKRPISVSSISSSASVSDRIMSDTEQYFLYQAHATLVQRITDLERALAASQPRSRPVSRASEASTRSSTPLAPEEPSDEMLQLIADLKAERDELSKDIDGWRVRVSDLEKHVGVLSQRVDLERREAWVARQRTGLLEVEKIDFQKSLEAMGVELQAALARCDVSHVEAEVLREECERLRVDLKAKSSVEEELCKLRAELDEERKARGELEAALKASMESRVNRRAPAFSIDSQATDVEYSAIEDFKSALRSVAEEESEDYSDLDDDLAIYEREEEDDDTFSSQLSGVSSIEDVSRSVSALKAEIASAPAPSSHNRHPSLTAWTFPSDPQSAISTPKPTEVDKFFRCLEYDEEEEASMAVRAAVTGDSGKGLFSQGLLVDDEDLPPFLIPAQTGFEVAEEKPSLDTIEEGEEDETEQLAKAPYEDDFGGEVVEGGIVFTFSPPEDSDVSSELATPPPPRSTSQSPRVFSPSQDEDEELIVSSMFPRVAAPPVTPPQKPSGVAISSSSHSSPVQSFTPIRKNTPPAPSSIPRAVALKSYAATTPTKTSPLERIVLNRSNTFSTPPSKRSSPTPAPEPQFQSKASSKPSPPSFIRQPQRSSTLPSRSSMYPPLSMS